MNKHEKKRRMQLPGGLGANVIEGDLSSAIRHWKQDLKNSGIMKKLYEKREFIKPSILRKRIMEKAIYRNLMSLKENK